MLACEFVASSARLEALKQHKSRSGSAISKCHRFVLCFSYGEGDVFSNSGVAIVHGDRSSLSSRPDFFVCRHPTFQICRCPSRSCLPVCRSTALVERNQVGPHCGQVRAEKNCLKKRATGGGV